MLNCELCDYYKQVISNNKDNVKGICEYTGFVFKNQPEDYDAENYPCYDYQVYNTTVEDDEFGELLVANK